MATLCSDLSAISAEALPQNGQLKTEQQAASRFQAAIPARQPRSRLGHDRPGTFCVFIDGRKTFALRLFIVADMNPFSAPGEVFKSTVAI